MATLQDEQGHIVRLKGWHTVGRLPSCELRLQSRKISNFHAVVHWDGTHWILKDMGSTNGTWLDGEPLHEVALEGKRIELRTEVLPSRPLGYAAFQTRAGLSSLKLRQL